MCMKAVTSSPEQWNRNRLRGWSSPQLLSCVFNLPSLRRQGLQRGIRSGRCRDKTAGPSLRRKTYWEIRKPSDRFPRDTVHCSPRDAHPPLQFGCRAGEHRTDSKCCCFPSFELKVAVLCTYLILYMNSIAMLNGDVFLYLHSWQQNSSKVKMYKMRQNSRKC